MPATSFARGALASLLALGAVGLLVGPLAGQSEGARPQAPPPGTAMVFVNTQAILPQAPGAREAQQTWQQELQEYSSEVQRLQAEVDSLMAGYRRQEAMLSPQVREQRQQEILQKQQELQLRAAELEQRAGERQQELLGPILERVQRMIEEIRTEKNYTIVFDMAGSGVVAADPSLDITALVLERLERQGQGPAGARRQP